MLCVKVRRGNDLQGPLAIASVVNIALGIGMLVSETVSGFMLNHYSAFYEDTLSSMIESTNQ